MLLALINAECTFKGFLCRGKRRKRDERKSNPCLIQFACARESGRGIVYK